MNNENTPLKMLLYEFNAEANEFLRTDYINVDDASARFLKYIEEKPLIRSFLNDCVQQYLPDGFNADAIVDEVSASPNTLFGKFAHSYQGESAEVYLILKSITERNKWKNTYLLYGYGQGSKKLNDKVRAFQDEVSRRLVNGIERYLTLIGISRGLNDMQAQQITAGDGSTIIAAQSSGNSTATATQTSYSMDTETLSKLIDNLAKSFDKLTEDQRQQAENYTSALKDELADKKPKSKVVKMLLTGLRSLSKAAEFVNAVKTIQDFVIPLLPA